MYSSAIEVIKSLVTVASAAGGVVVFWMGVSSYRRTEKWKKAEFLANEMKEFFASPRIQRTLLLIDWGHRDIQLLEYLPLEQSHVIVDRKMQTMALRPHVLLDKTGSDPEIFSTDGKDHEAGFSPPEAAIRDCYDTFLDGLERFSSYVRTGLVELPSLRPYLGYWIHEISCGTENVDDAAWCAALLTYIAFYNFEGVLWLFDAFGQSISPESSAYLSFLKLMKDQPLAHELAASIKFQYPPHRPQTL